MAGFAVFKGRKTAVLRVYQIERRGRGVARWLSAVFAIRLGEQDP